jgi:pimeloyl-ACP methyl ester carboxylesterase
MPDLYTSPTFFGVEDTVAQGTAAPFPVRIYYPSDGHVGGPRPVNPGPFPLVVFAHGDRSGEPSICPPDIQLDHERWGNVLRLLARCGFVIAVPAVWDVISSSEATAERIEDSVNWMRSKWTSKAVLRHPSQVAVATARSVAGEQAEGDASGSVPSIQEGQAVDGGPPKPRKSFVTPGGAFNRGPFRHIPLDDDVLAFGVPTRLGLIGHSWGARACARVAVRGRVSVSGMGFIAGTWDENEAITAVRDARASTLMICGTGDGQTFSYLPGLWPSLAAPKFQAAIQGLGHWDWFGPHGEIRPCKPADENTMCPAGWQIASELLLGFMTRTLRKQWWRNPNLMEPTGERPPLEQWFEPPRMCSVKVRWMDPLVSDSFEEAGQDEKGTWIETAPW